jgi:superoxide reductase
MGVRFFKCSHCGNIVTFVGDKHCTTTCCGELMTELLPNKVEASVEKHVPVVSVVDQVVNVEVGSIPHPSTVEHHIAWIAISTEKGVQIKYLEHTSPAKVTFVLAQGEKLDKVYAYCNLHGLWSN